MQKPKNYDNVQEFGEYQPLEIGGHILKILKMEETFSKSGRPMVKIHFDTAENDRQPGYYKRRYDSDSRSEKKWGGIVYQLTEDAKTGETAPMFKTFTESVKKSNSSNFQLVWDDTFCERFKGRLVGGIFRREEFVIGTGKRAGQKAFATKCFMFRSVAAIGEGIDPPADKLLSEEDYQKELERLGLSAPSLNSYSAQTPMTETDDDYPF